MFAHGLREPAVTEGEQPVVALAGGEVADAAVGVVREHEARVAPGGAVTHPGGLHHGDGRIRAEFAEPARGGEAAGAGAQHRVVHRVGAAHHVGRRRVRQDLEPAVALVRPGSRRARRTPRNGAVTPGTS